MVVAWNGSRHFFRNRFGGLSGGLGLDGDLWSAVNLRPMSSGCRLRNIFASGMEGAMNVTAITTQVVP